MVTATRNEHPNYGWVPFEEFWIFGDNASKDTIKNIGILSHLCNSHKSNDYKARFIVP